MGTAICMYTKLDLVQARRSIEGNTNDSYELLIEGLGRYCPDCPDDPACTEFLRDPSNKKPFIVSGSVCDHAPYHPGCPQIVDPERYCLSLSVDDPFCKTIGDLCDADGFVTRRCILFNWLKILEINYFCGYCFAEKYEI